jgi:two-component system LytT family response regulator/two-component system response regulator AlgR
MTNALRVALADDEPLARARLGRLLREAGCEVAAELSDGPTLLAWLKEGHEVDALFLDIQMPGLSGLEVMAELSDGQECPPVVFVTAFSEHAVRAFEAQALDYILKPLSAERLEKSLARLRQGGGRRRTAGELKSILSGQPRFPVKAGDGYVFLDLKRTTHFEVEEEVVYAHAPGSGKLQRYRTDWTSLAEVEEAFPSAGLLRIQRHLLLRPEAVLGLRPLDGGRAAVRVADGVDLEVSRSVTPRMKELLGL